MRSLTLMIRAGLTAAACGLVWMTWPRPAADWDYAPRLEQPAFTGLPRPRVLFDDGHLNTHTSSGLFRPFTRLLQHDGFRVVAIESRLTAETLSAGDLLVTVNPLGYKGLAQHLANLVHLQRIVNLDADAFAAAEVNAVREWIGQGGRALIVADQGPAGRAAATLSRAFGVEMTNWWPENRGSAEMTFSRANGGLLDHPIANGRTPAERVENVTTYAGQTLQVAPGTEVLLRLTDTARAYLRDQPSETEGRSASALALAVAVRYQRGRVVIVADAAALSAQRITRADAPPLLIGMNRTGSGNQQFTLNVVHWLVGLLP